MHKNVEAHNIWEIKLTLFLDYLFTEAMKVNKKVMERIELFHAHLYPRV